MINYYEIERNLKQARFKSTPYIYRTPLARHGIYTMASQWCASDSPAAQLGLLNFHVVLININEMILNVIRITQANLSFDEISSNLPLESERRKYI